MYVTIPRHHVFTRNERTFSSGARKLFVDPFLDISSRFWGKIFFMKISENPGPLPGGKFFFRFFFFPRRFTFFPPPPKLALGLLLGPCLRSALAPWYQHLQNFRKKKGQKKKKQSSLLFKIEKQNKKSPYSCTLKRHRTVVRQLANFFLLFFFFMQMFSKTMATQNPLLLLPFSRDTNTTEKIPPLSPQGIFQKKKNQPKVGQCHLSFFLPPFFFGVLLSLL